VDGRMPLLRRLANFNSIRLSKKRQRDRMELPCEVRKMWHNR
jgi:hypothetical protein